MAAEQLDAFISEGMVRYGGALRVVLAFEEALQERLTAALNERERSLQWKKFRTTGRPESSVSRSSVELYATQEGQFGHRRATLVVGVSWDDELLQGASGGSLFAGFTVGSKFHVPLVVPPGVARVRVAQSWGDRWLVMLPKDQLDFTAD